MAEVVALASGIAGLVSLTIQITQLSSQYISDVANAPRVQKDYLREVLALGEVLLRFEDAFQQTQSISSLIPRSSIISEDFLLHCKESLASQQSKLEQHRHRLAWPFHERDLRRAIEDLNRYRGIFADCLAASTSITTTATLRQVDALKDGNDRRELLEWLKVPPEAVKEMPEHLPGTGDWLLNHPRFQSWITDPPSILWCYGPPGAGKSGLASVVAAQLASILAPQKVAVVHFFADFFRRKEQSEVRILQTILQQAIFQVGSDSLSTLMEEKAVLGSSPGPSGLMNLFCDLCTKQKTYLVFDAIDELENAPRITGGFEKFVDAGYRILITGRDQWGLNCGYRKVKSISIAASESDLTAYVEHRFSASDFADLVKSGARHPIIDGIVRKANGVFLLARLLMDRLLGLTTVKKMRQALATLPTEFKKAFESSIDRIDSQPEPLRNLAYRAIRWILHAERPLKSTEILHAFAVDFDEDDIDEEDVGKITTLLRSCAGLVTLDKPDDTLVFVHKSVYDFFESNETFASEESQRDFSRTCLSYICLRPLQAGPCVSLEMMKSRLTHLPFLTYAAQHCGNHVSHGDMEEAMKNLLERLFNDESLLASLVQALHYKPLIRSHDIAVASFESQPKGLTPLHLASFWGLQNTTRDLLIAGGNANITDSQQWTPLHWATANGHTHVIEVLLKYSANTEATDSQGWTPLFWASFKGHSEAVQFLVDNGADFTAKDSHGWIPLRWAVSAGQSEAIKVLQDEYARVIATKSRAHQDDSSTGKRSKRWLFEDWSYARTSSMINFASEAEDMMLFDKLMATSEHEDLWTKGSLDPPMSNMWEISGEAEFGHHGMDRFHPNSEEGHATSPKLVWKSRMLFAAIRDEKLQVVKLLLETGADVNLLGRRSALHVATFRKDPEYVRTLLEWHADPNAKDVNGQTPLHQAVLNGFIQPITLLLEAGSDVNAQRPNCYDVSGQTPLMLACGAGDLGPERSSDVVDLLLQYGADLTLRDDTDRNYLHYAAESAQLGLARKALAAGADAKCIDKSGTTPLHLAAKARSSEVVKLLITHGADATARDNEGRTPLHNLAENRLYGLTATEQEAFFELVYSNSGPDLLNAEAANGGRDKHTALSLAISGSNWEMYDILRRAGAKLPMPVPSLAFGVIRDKQPQVLQFLIENGLTLSQKDIAMRFTTLFDFRLKDDPIGPVCELLDIFLDMGLELNPKGDWPGIERGSWNEKEEPVSCLVYAAGVCDSGEMAKFLISRGADVFYANDAGEDAVLVAAMHGNMEFLIEVLHLALGRVPPGHWLEKIDASSWRDPDALPRICDALQASGRIDALIGVHGTLLQAAVSTNSEGYSKRGPSNPEFIRELVLHGASLNVSDKYGWQPLHFAALHGDADLLELMIKRGGAEINATTSAWCYDTFSGVTSSTSRAPETWKATALHIAILRRRVDVVKRLVQLGADVNASTGVEDLAGSQGEFGPSALDIALSQRVIKGRDQEVVKQMLEIMSILVSNGAEVGLTEEDRKGFKGYEDVWEILMGRRGAMAE